MKRLHDREEPEQWGAEMQVPQCCLAVGPGPERFRRTKLRVFGLCLLGCVLGVGGQATFAADQTIELFNSAFLPQSVTIDLGDTVTWVWVAGTHVVTSGLPSGMPGTPNEPGLLFSQTVDASNPTFSYTFSTYSPTGFAFFDANHPAQIGFIALSVTEQTFVVRVLDNVFEPDLVEIFAGDSVRWEHEPMEMAHTVTSGLSSAPADNPGAVFNALSTDSQPVFVFQFLQAGDQPYFCIPHELLGMTGLVSVQRRFVRGDANEDGSVTIADPVVTLAYLFQGAAATCLDAHDVNDDGSIDVADAVSSLGYLFAGGPEPDDPFPADGADRTDDSLRCY